MNRFKLQGYVKEFPFLEKINDAILNEESTKIDFIKISKVDENLLNKTPSYEGTTGSMVGIDTGEKIYFVLEDGMLYDAVTTKGYIRHNEAYEEDECWEGETILEAIDSNQIADCVKYIIVENYGYKIENHYSEGGLSFTIYKVAKNETIKEIIEEIKQKELDLIKAEANF